MTPAPANHEEVAESNLLFRDVWRQFALGTGKGEVTELEHTLICNGNVRWFFLNTAMLRGPLETAEDVEAMVADAVAYFAHKPVGWAMPVCREWLGAGASFHCLNLLMSHGLGPGVELAGMVGDREWIRSSKAAGLKVTLATTQDDVNAVADINSDAYGVSREWGREVFGGPDQISEDAPLFIGSVDGTAVASAGVVRSHGVLYACLVATLPAHQHKGYAEAVLSSALEHCRAKWGLTRSVLHATPAGAPVYERMGFRKVCTFDLYMKLPPKS